MNWTGYSAVTAAIVVASPAFGQVSGVLQSTLSTATAPRSTSSTLSSPLSTPPSGNLNMISAPAETRALNPYLDGASSGSVSREHKGTNSTAAGEIATDGRVSVDRAGNASAATRMTEWVHAIMRESKRVLTHTGERVRVEIPPARHAVGQAGEGINDRARNQARNARQPVTRAENGAGTPDAIDEFPAAAEDKSIQALER